MHKYVARACVATAAAVAVSTVGWTGASAASMSSRVPRAVRAPSARAARAPGGPGTQQWVKRYNGPGKGIDDATSVAVSPDGKTVFVTGHSAGVGAAVVYDYATVAYNATTGAQQWVQRYNGPGNGDDLANSVAVSPDGKTVFVTGSSYGGSTTGYDYATVAYSAASGAQLWAKRYKGPAAGGTDAAHSVAVSGSTVYVTGSSDSTVTGSSDYATVAYSTTGHQLWVARYNGPAGGDYAQSVAVSGSTVYVTGSSLGTNDGFDYATVAYNAATGHQQWVARYNGATSGQRGANTVAVSPDGNTVFVTGSSFGGSTTSYDYATVAYNAATGHQQWVKRYTSPGNGDDQANSVAVSPAGNMVFVTGSSTGAGNLYDYATVAYNATTGQQVWVKHYNGALGLGDNQAFSVAVSPSGGTVYVTGSGDADSNYATIAYNATNGTQQWAKRYTGSGPDGGGATWAAVSPTTGTVYVTGHSSGNGTGYDYATVAYQG
jgi:sugar lactone lactonase YvrE